MSIAEASRYFENGLTRTSLRRYINKCAENRTDIKMIYHQKEPRLLTANMETDLAKYVMELSVKCYGLSTKN